MMEQMWLTFGRTLADVAFWIGLIATVIFACGRFNERHMDIRELDPPVLVRAFTTRFRYSIAAFAYAGVYAALYVLLILLGTIPEFQQYLKEWIGTVRDEAIGTPTWAALATTALLPAIPAFRRVDEQLRLFLYDFASIPLKARNLAQEVVSGVHQKLRAAGCDSAAATYETMREAIRMLSTSNRRAARAYMRFFHDNGLLEEELHNRFERLCSQADADGRGAYDEQMETLVQRLSRLLACGMLQVEPDEYTARRVIIEDLGITGIVPQEWRFKMSQIMLGAVLIVVCVPITSLAASRLLLIAIPGTEVSWELLWRLGMKALYAGVLAVPVFVLPLVCAAGSQMYLLDRMSSDRPLEWDETAVALIFTFAGCFGLAVLPLLIAAAVSVAGTDLGIPIAQVVPWALPAAAVASAFVLVSSVDPTGNRLMNAGIDFVVHGLIAGFLAWLATLAAFAAGLDPEQKWRVPPEFVSIVVPIVALVTGGLVGALQCLISRQMSGDRLPQHWLSGQALARR